ncbi:SagB/ThcOx family dehydrogenase [Cohnella sp. CFH 77786]|uniref:SagB family peptide dehydrogenase n=1 Tax=Cohnella sp. CFH 77786 TaxID=2662265 RepID=UPI001C6105BF|nr:SagB family peptide dehydrogenase [Cohnella sp. CFH 77786]MBW5446409.1 SagB/ThcOx family dehydrogenase [Cohnella sp. CFH 77786]
MKNMTKSMTTAADHLSIFQYRRGREYEGNRFDLSPRPERFKKYNGPCLRLKTSVYKDEGLRSVGGLTGREMLERILLPSFGVTSVKFHGHQSEMLWSFPSAGGCYPVEIYVAVRRLGEVEPGLYYYCALETSLYKLANGQAAGGLAPSLREADRDADVYFILSVVPWRTCWKYSHKGYRFGLLDAGHVAANFQLVLRALGFRFSAYTSLHSAEVGELLQLDEYEMPIAIIASRLYDPKADDPAKPSATDAPPLESPISRKCRHSEDPDIRLFDWEPILDFQRKVELSVREPSDRWLTQLSLPSEWTDYGRLLQLIIERRSSSAYTRCELAAAEFRAMLTMIFRLGLHSSFHAIVHGVEGVRPGVYRYEYGRPVCLSEGNYRETSSDICLGQAFIRDCSVLFVFSVDASHIPEDEFSRYQQCSIDGGMLGQMMYLKSQEMGLGFSIIGGYYDEELRELLQLPPTHQIVCAGAWGRNVPDAASVRKNDRYQLNRPQR